MSLVATPELNGYKLKRKKELREGTIFIIENQMTHYEYIFGKKVADPSLYYYSDLLFEWLNVDARPDYIAIFQAVVP